MTAPGGTSADPMPAGPTGPDPMSLDPESRVRTLLAAAGLSPGEEELAVLVAQYPMHLEGVQLLHNLPDARYEAPGLVFDALPRFADWAS